MKWFAASAAALLIAAPLAFAADTPKKPDLTRFSVGAYLSYWNADDLNEFDGEGFFGGGVQGQVRLLDFLALDLRISAFAAGEDEDVYVNGQGWYENSTTLAAIPLEAGLLGLLNVTDKFSLYGGPGIGFYLFDGEFRSEQGPWDHTCDLDIDDETGFYAVLGARYQLARNVALFAEGKYTWVDTTVEEDLGAITDEVEFGDLSLSQDLDLDGFALQAGLLFTF